MPIDSFYLPHEVINVRNYPELRTYRADIETILSYSRRASVALADYNEGRYDRIDLNMEEVQSHINLCRAVSEALGKAANVCYDVLLEIRTTQYELQNILFLKKRYGDRIVGVPTNIASEGGGV